MAKTKMTKSKWGLVLLLMIAIGATAIHRSIASNQEQDHQHHQQSQQGKKNLPPPLTNIATNPVQNSSLAKGKFITEDIPGAIDGTKEPGRIPDRVSYLLFFRLASSDENKRHIKAERLTSKEVIKKWLKVQGFAERTCDTNLPIQTQITEGDIEKLAEASLKFRERIRELDERVKAIKDKTWPHPSMETMLILTEMQKQKESLVDSLALSLQQGMSSKGQQAFYDYLVNMKKFIRMFPSPSSPPGTKGWKPVSEKNSIVGHAH